MPLASLLTLAASPLSPAAEGDGKVQQTSSKLTTQKNQISRKNVIHQGREIPLTLNCNLQGFDDLQPRLDEIGQLYFEAWLQLVKIIGSPVNNTHRDITLQFENKMDHPAHASGQTIVISAKHLRNNPADTMGVFIHELTHIIQRHGGPGWLIEGVADYTRYKLNGNDPWAKRCRQKIYYTEPFGHYWKSAAFLLYLEDTYKKPIVHPVSVSLRAKTYQKEIWVQLTGKTLEKLATDYKTSGWKPATPQHLPAKAQKSKP